MTRDELQKALQMIGRLRDDRASLSRRNREWLASYLEREAIKLMESGKRGRHGKHDERNFWLTMDYLVNGDLTEKELQSRWNLKTRIHKIVATWRNGCDGVLKHYHGPSGGFLPSWEWAIDKYRAAYIRRPSASNTSDRSGDFAAFLIAAARADSRDNSAEKPQRRSRPKLPRALQRALAEVEALYRAESDSTPK